MLPRLALTDTSRVWMLAARSVHVSCSVIWSFQSCTPNGMNSAAPNTAMRKMVRRRRLRLALRSGCFLLCFLGSSTRLLLSSLVPNREIRLRSAAAPKQRQRA